MPGAVGVRVMAEADAAPLAALLHANRGHLAPWDPARPEDHFTVEGQRREIGEALARSEAGSVWPCVVLVDGAIAGRITLNNVVRGAFLSADLGYWIAAEHTGRGVATAAVATVLDTAWADLGLHRVQAGTLPHNVASQRVLARNGFERIGYAPQYLRIAGRWQDHVLFQRLTPEPG